VKTALCAAITFCTTAGAALGKQKGMKIRVLEENLHSAPPARTIALGVNINFKNYKGIK
jgi:hypothetical protein